MNIFTRASNLWKLSELEKRPIGAPPPEVGTQVIQLVKRPQAKFIARVVEDPIKNLVEEKP